MKTSTKKKIYFINYDLIVLPTPVRSAQGGAGEELATSFENKKRFLADEFFPAPPPADLSDIPGAAYLMSMHCPSVVTKKEVVKAMKKLNLNKTFKSNNIINWFLKTCENGLINVLIIFSNVR